MIRNGGKGDREYQQVLVASEIWEYVSIEYLGRSVRESLARRIAVVVFQGYQIQGRATCSSLQIVGHCDVEQ
jgi:hypothetical protein